MAWPSPNGKMNDAPQMRCEGQNVQCLELTKRECIRCQILINIQNRFWNNSVIVCPCSLRTECCVAGWFSHSLSLLLLMNVIMVGRSFKCYKTSGVYPALRRTQRCR